MVPHPNSQQFVSFRDYLMTVITFLNGHRPMVLRNLTIEEFRRATVHVVEGPEPQAERTYMSFLVAKHKTSRTRGAAIISVPMTLFREMVAYRRLTQRLHGLPDSAPFFTTVDGSAIMRSSNINAMVKRSYKMSGVQQEYPQKFTITQTRKLLTSVSRDLDPSSAALIAAQLCHSVAQADRVYRLQAQRSQSSRAVHHMTQAVSASHTYEQQTPRLAMNYIAKIDARIENEGENDKLEERREGGIENNSTAERIENEGDGERMIESDKLEERREALKSPEVRIWSESESGEEEEEEEEEDEGEELGYDPDEMESDWEEREQMVRDWVNKHKEARKIYFRNMPNDREDIVDQLIGIFPTLDYDNINEEAQYWVHQSSVTELASSTSYFLAASALGEELRDRFDLRLSEIVRSTAPQNARGHPSLNYVIQMIISARLAVLFGINIDIRDANTDTLSADSKGTPKIPDHSPDSIPLLDSAANERAANEPAAIASNRRRLPSGLGEALQSIFPTEIIDSAASGKKIKKEVIREHWDEIHSLFPHIDELKVRDKLWTLSKRMRHAYDQSEKKKKKDESATKCSKRKPFPAEVKEGLREIYHDLLNVSISLNSRIPMADVRERMDQVISRVGNFSTQQIRDKLWTMAKQARRDAGHTK